MWLPPLPGPHPVPGTFLPMISVVIPVFNGATTIGDQLSALGAQDMDLPWEVVVADNGSTDDTVEVVRRHAGVLPRLTVVDASGRRGPAAARNMGVAAAVGDVFAFCDADDVVAPGWLATMARATAVHDFVAGGLDFNFCRPDLDRPEPALEPIAAPTGGSYGWLKYALAANMAVSRSAFAAAGGFAEELHAGEDLDLSWRLQIAGHPLHYEPGALVHKRPRPNNRQLMRQQVNYGRHDVVLYKRLRGAGMPRRPLMLQVKLYGWAVLNTWRLAAGGKNRATWICAVSAEVGRVIGSVQHRTLYL